MRFYLDLKYQLGEHEGIGPIADELVADAQRAIDATRDWTPILGADLDDLVNDMAGQLPRDDADAFLSNVYFGFRSRALEAGLTGSLQKIHTERGLTSIRLRIRAFTQPELEARLPTIGLELTNLLMRALPSATVGAMIIWKERNRKPVLEGQVRERGNMIDALRESKQSAWVLGVAVLALGALILGVLVETLTVNHFSFWFLGSDAFDWFKRLVGPFLTALIASGTVVLLEWRRLSRPEARWFVEGSSTLPRLGKKRRRRIEPRPNTGDTGSPDS